MPEATSIMAGKRGLIMGVANDRSLAWGIAKTVAEHGAELAFTFQGEALEKRVRPLAESLGSVRVMPCDVTDDASVDATFSTLEEAWGDLDFVVHAIAFSDKDELKGKYINTSRENFNRTLDISCYSLTAIAQRAVPLMRKGGSLLTLTYYGAERVMPHYNVMGVAKAALEASVRYLAVDLGDQSIRVNAISPGLILTDRVRQLLPDDDPIRTKTPLGPSEPEHVAPLALYLASEDSRQVSGAVLPMDGGASVV